MRFEFYATRGGIEFYTTEVFTELLYRIRKGRYTLSADEAKALKSCENDLQIRALTTGYMTGAGFYRCVRSVRDARPECR